MTTPRLPRYPVYVPSKGRAATCHTARFLLRDAVPFFLVVEEPEVEQYARYGRDHLLVLPFVNQGLIAARNWIKAHSIADGHARHWQLDDNIREIRRRYHARRIPCAAGPALAITENFVDRYENVGIAGLNYSMFLATGASKTPFCLNVHVYSCSLILNSLPYAWRSPLNDDTDLCLQVLAGGWCTVAMNLFSIDKQQTMHAKGGNTGIYQGDGRLKMARSLERLWPGVVTTNRRFQRPQHIVYDSWKRFDTPLKLKPGLDLSALPPVDEHGMELVQVASDIQSAALREFIAAHPLRSPEDRS